MTDDEISGLDDELPAWALDDVHGVPGDDAMPDDAPDPDPPADDATPHEDQEATQ